MVSQPVFATDETKKVEFIDNDGDTQILNFLSESQTWNLTQLTADQNKARLGEGANTFGLIYHYEPQIDQGNVELFCEESIRMFWFVTPETLTEKEQYWHVIVPKEENRKNEVMKNITEWNPECKKRTHFKHRITHEEITLEFDKENISWDAFNPKNENQNSKKNPMTSTFAKELGMDLNQPEVGHLRRFLMIVEMEAVNENYPWLSKCQAKNAEWIYFKVKSDELLPFPRDTVLKSNYCQSMNYPTWSYKAGTSLKLIGPAQANDLIPTKIINYEDFSKVKKIEKNELPKCRDTLIAKEPNHPKKTPIENLNDREQSAQVKVKCDAGFFNENSPSENFITYECDIGSWTKVNDSDRCTQPDYAFKFQITQQKEVGEWSNEGIWFSGSKKSKCIEFQNDIGCWNIFKESVDESDDKYRVQVYQKKNDGKSECVCNPKLNILRGAGIIGTEIEQTILHIVGDIQISFVKLEDPKPPNKN